MTLFVSEDFYSRPCGRGDPVCGKTYPVIVISTHAPAGGATRHDLAGCQVHQKISTHAPAGGATNGAQPFPQSAPLFLLTPLREGRRGRSRRTTSPTRFLLTPLREGRRQAGNPPVAPSRFLLTPLREGRPGRYSDNRRNDWYFYSRPCGRGDGKEVAVERILKISTHAPAGGATRRCRSGSAWRNISTHAPAGGATTKMYEMNRDMMISTHAPAGGATKPTS